jgi:hypothetical protein
MRDFPKILSLFFLLFASVSNAQLIIDAELRPRFEYRHGFKSLFPDNTDPAAFVSQRTRLNTGYTNETLKLYLSLQDVRVWGDVPQLNITDRNELGIHQAWGELFFNPSLSIRLGRQEISYDDERIFGNVEWAQQARSHDAALLRFVTENFTADLGFAFNQDMENSIGNTLTIPNTYKSIQYLWIHKDWHNLQTSFLFLNNGMQYVDTDKNETRYSQTIGSHLKYSFGKIKLFSNLYYQFGNDVFNNDIDSYLVALEVNYSVSQQWIFTLGTELISGNEDGVPRIGKNNAFSPLYGTNHKFNGLMDYFYVGNHNDNVGLWDLYAKSKLAMNQKSNLVLAIHNFTSASKINEDISNQLGMEADLVYMHTINNNSSLSIGYSHLIVAQGMQVVKNSSSDNTNNWGWIMVKINPVLIKNEIPQ